MRGLATIAVIWIALGAMLDGCHGQPSRDVTPAPVAGCSAQPSGCGDCRTAAECGADATWDITH